MIRNIFILIMLFIFGCKQPIQIHYVDVWQKMYDVISREHNYSNPNTKIISFHHIGDINIKGETFYVAYIHYVLLDMICPRGNSRLVFFNKKLEHCKKYDISSVGMPLRCEKSRIYFKERQYLQGFMYGTVLEFKDKCYNGQYELMVELPGGKLVPGGGDPDKK